MASTSGGAFIFAPVETAPNFWRHVQEELLKCGMQTEIAILDYSELCGTSFYSTEI